jgi:DNA-binding protein
MSSIEFVTALAEAISKAADVMGLIKKNILSYYELKEEIMTRPHS